MSSKNTKIKPISSPLPTVVLFGRTNVGKSTLFNKLTGKSHALISTIAGTTRDSNVGIVDWQGRQFQLVDTGGILNTKFLRGKHKLKKFDFAKDNIDNLVQLQVKEHLKRADLILFMVDSKEGLMEQDKEMVILLKRIISKKTPSLLVANKIDTKRQRDSIAEFYQLSLGDPLPVSAATGSGTGDLLDRIVKESNSLKGNWIPRQTNDEIKIILLGRPNVGKSTLLNAIIGEKKVIVSDIPHTTREPKDFSVQYQNQILTFIDTAGIIKAKSKRAKEELIKLGMVKSRATLKRADIALLILDIAEEISHLETKIADEILEQGVSAIIVANKWDKAGEKNSKQFTNYINSKLPFITWAPIIFLSAKNKTKIKQLLDLIFTVHQARNKTITEEELENFLRAAVRRAAPLSNTKARGIFKHKFPKPKLKKLAQIRTDPLEFVLHIKSKTGLKDNYVKYLENRLRDKFGLVGTPITIKIKNQK